MFLFLVGPLELASRVSLLGSCGGCFVSRLLMEVAGFCWAFSWLLSELTKSTKEGEAKANHTQDL